jgi:hypothetical protein
MAGLTDEERAQYLGTGSSPTSVMEPPATGLSVNERQELQLPTGNEPVTQSPPPYAGAVSQNVLDQAKAAAQYIGDGYNMSEDQTNQAIGWNKAVLGLIKTEEAQALYNPNTAQVLRDKRVETMDKQHMYDTLWATKEIFSSLPYLKQLAVNAVEGSATVGVPAAGAGAVIGGEAGVLGGPLGEVTIPAGAAAGAVSTGLWGAAFGARLGVMKSAAEIGAGSMYQHLINNGVDPKTARPAALAAGTVGAVLQGWFLNNPITKVTPLLEGEIGQSVAEHALTMAGVFVKGIAAMDLQRAGEYASRYLVAQVDKHEPIPTWDEIKEGMVQATATGALLGATAIATGEGLNRIVNYKAKQEGIEPPVGPISQQAKLLTDHLSQAADSVNKENQLLTMKLRLDVARKEEAVSNAVTALEDARTEGKPLKAKKLALRVANTALDLAKDKLPGAVPVVENPLPTLQGRVEKQVVPESKTAAEASAKRTALEQELSDAKALARKTTMDRSILKRRIADEIFDAGSETDPLQKDFRKGRVRDLRTRLENATQDRNFALEIEKDAQEKLDAIDEKAQKKALARIKSLVSKPTIKKEGRITKATVGTDEKPILELYSWAIEDPKAAAKFLEQVMYNPSEVEGGIADNKIKIFVCDQTAGLEDMTANQINTIADEIEVIRNTGKSKREEKLLARKAELKALVHTAREMALGNKTYDEILAQTADPKLKRFVRDRFRTIGHTMATWPGLADIVDQDSQHPAGSFANLVNVTKETNGETDAVNIQIRKYTYLVMNNDPNAVEKVSEYVAAGNDEKNWGTYTEKKKNEKGELMVRHGVPLVRTPNQLFKLALQFNDPELKKGLQENHKGNGFTYREDVAPGETSTQEVIENGISSMPHGNDVLRGTAKMFQQYGKERLQPWFVDRYGVGLKLNDFYSGLAERENLPIETTDAIAPVFDRRSLTPGSVIARTNNGFALAPANIFDDVARHITAFEHMIAFADKAEELQAVFGDGEFKRIVIAKFGNDGENFWANIDDARKTICGTNIRRQNIAFKDVQALRRHAGTALVAGKAIQFFKQWTAFLYYAHEMPVPELLTGIVNYFAHKNQADNVLSESKFLRGRKEDLRRQITNEQASDYGIRFEPDNKLTKESMLFVQAGDISVIRAGGYALYKYTYDHADGTPQERREKALAAFDRVSEETQSSSAPSQQTAWDRSGEIGRSLTLFRRQNMQSNRYVAREIRHFVNSPSVEGGVKIFRSVLINFMASLMFKAMGRAGVYASAGAINYFTGAQQKELDWVHELTELTIESLLDPTSGWMIYGDIQAYMAMSTLSQGAKAIGMTPLELHEPSSLNGDVIAHGIALSSDITKIAIKGLLHAPITLGELLQAMHDADRSVMLRFSGFPFEAGVQPVRAWDKAAHPTPHAQSGLPKEEH